jgi:hypothetical protein
VAPHGSRRRRAHRSTLGRVDGFRYQALLNIGSGCADHSGLMPANLITLAHFSVSSAISFSKSAGEPGSVVPPRSASRALILGSARAALISLLTVNDFGGRIFGRADAGPEARLVARDEITHGRDVRQRLRARRGGHRQRANFAGPDVFDR